MTDEETKPISDQSPSDDQTNSEDVTPEVDTQVDTEEEHPGKKSAEARINELLAKNKELEEKLTVIEEKMAPPPPPPTDNSQELTPELLKAKQILVEKLGLVTKEEQDKKIREIQDRAYLDAEHGRLENRFSGSDGRPKYEKKEIEDYMRKRGIYDPEAAYEQLYKKELFDFELKKYEEGRKKKPFVQKPGSSAGTREDQTITREKIAEWIKTPEGRTKYEQNREKILKMMAEGQL